MKKAVVLISLSFYSFLGFNQPEEAYKEKQTTFGFSLGGSQTMIKSDETSLENFKINNSSGFRLGILMDQKIAKSIYISPKAELGFSNSNVVFSQKPDIILSEPIYNTHLEFMTHLVWRGSNLKINPYVLFGPSIRVPLIEDNAVRITNNYDAGIDIGIGLDKKFSNFNLMPEIRLSSGFMNILQSNTLPKTRYNSISLIFNFRG